MKFSYILLLNKIIIYIIKILNAIFLKNLSRIIHLEQKENTIKRENLRTEVISNIRLIKNFSVENKKSKLMLELN